MSHPIQSGDRFVLQPSRHCLFSLEYLLQVKFDREKHLRRETQRGVPLQNHLTYVTKDAQRSSTCQLLWTDLETLKPHVQ